jgi:hypothetical protein
MLIEVLMLYQQQLQGRNPRKLLIIKNSCGTPLIPDSKSAIFEYPSGDIRTNIFIIPLAEEIREYLYLHTRDKQAYQKYLLKIY